MKRFHAPEDNGWAVDSAEIRSQLRHAEDATHRDHESPQSNERAYAGLGSARNRRHRPQRWRARTGG